MIGSPYVAVFFPALMGVGIIVSGALLVADWMRRLVPRGGVRRQRRIAMGVHGVVAGAMQAAGLAVSEPDFLRRRLRPRWVYLLWGSVGILVGVLVVQVGVARYLDPVDLLYENPWSIGLGIGIGTALILTAAGAVLAPMLYGRSRLIDRLVESTVLGRVGPPPTDVRLLAGKIQRTGDQTPRIEEV